MASAPSMSVSAECLNVCKLSRGEGSCGESGGGRYDCCVLSCAWKAPRALTGSLASTAQSWRSSTLVACRRISGRHGRVRHGYGSPDMGRSVPSEASFFGCTAWPSPHVAPEQWSLACSPSYFSETSVNVSPDSLWEDLRPAILYLSPIELDFVHKALKLAFEAHDGQKRRSGEPFIIHPVEVARILGELELDWECIAAGLLHDTVEDTDVVTFEKIEKEFGSAVRNIVEGETKVSKLGKLKYKDEEALQDVKADDLRQMFLAMTEEVRVIIVKLADRLHNMRTLSHMPPHKQASIALETLQVFAPLAKLLGMYQIKSELENLSFMYTNNQDYVKIRKKVADLFKKHERDINEANKILMNKIEDDQFLGLVTMKTEVHAVCKEPYSVYKAVMKSRSSIDEVNQMAQLCIVVHPKPGNGIGPLCSAEQICYHVLGLVHRIWTPVPRSMKDYIATSKPNGYQSLHTTVIPFLYESMFRLEVQIRTEEMDLIARRGIATHYSGKEYGNGIQRQVVNGRNSRGKLVGIKGNIGLRIGWLNAIRDWQEEFVGNMTSREFVDTITRDLLGSRVFVFTPRGEIKNLPKGATIVDYAYMIHTEIGNRMVAAKVNGNLVSPTHILANAEVVEIITYDALSNKTAWERQKKWLQHAKTRSARYKIMRFLREQTASSAAEVTADSQGTQVVRLSDISRGGKSVLGKTNGSLTPLKLSEDVHAKNCNLESFKFNGKPSVEALKMSLEGISRDGIAELLHVKTSMIKEVIPGLESWRTSKVAAWHNVEGHSVDWFCIVAIDRRGVMAEVTTVLSSLGISISSCVTEIDRTWGIAVMLFQIEGASHNLFDACSRIDVIVGVLRWSAGCSWQAFTEIPKLIEA